MTILEALANPKNRERMERYYREATEEMPKNDLDVSLYGMCRVPALSCGSNGYAQIKLVNKMFNMHRICLIHASQDEGVGMQAAHLCQNRACCEPCHLEWKTPSCNTADKLSDGTHHRGSLISTNTSGYVGVSFHKHGQKWVARIKIPNTRVTKYLGLFFTAREAAIAYNTAATALNLVIENPKAHYRINNV